VRNPPFSLNRLTPAIADAPERLDRVVLKCPDKFTLLRSERENLEDTVAGGDEVATEGTQLVVAERLVELADRCAATTTIASHWVATVSHSTSRIEKRNMGRGS
jgi:hypothetical protein